MVEGWGCRWGVRVCLQALRDGWVHWEAFFHMVAWSVAFLLAEARLFSSGALRPTLVFLYCGQGLGTLRTVVELAVVNSTKTTTMASNM